MSEVLQYPTRPAPPRHQGAAPPRSRSSEVSSADSPANEDLGQLGQDEPASGSRWTCHSNVIPRRAGPGQAGLGPHTAIKRWRGAGLQRSMRRILAVLVKRRQAHEVAGSRRGAGLATLRGVVYPPARGVDLRGDQGLLLQGLGFTTDLPGIDDKYSVGLSIRPICTRCCIKTTYMIQGSGNFR